MISFCCTFFVGSVLLFSGLIKTIDAGSFAGHVARYRLIPVPFVLMASFAFIGLESALGMAMILHVLPQYLVPVSMVLFTGFAALTLWGTRSGRIEDCGCYGGLVALTPNQSALLDMAYVAVLTVAWLFPAENYQTSAWKFVIIAIVLAGSVAVSRKSLGGPLVDLSRLKKDKRWQEKWLKASQNDLTQGSHFIVFLDRACSFCKRWVPLLNVINVQPELPTVTGIMSLTDPEVKAFKKEHLIRFPIAHMDKLLVKTMTHAFPTAVLIENSRIKEKWTGEMPQTYLDSIKQFYESILPKPGKEAVFKG